MDIERRKEEFQKYHKNIYNILFHLFCGIVYMSLFFSLFPGYVYVIYCVITLYLFPNVSVFAALSLVALARMYPHKMSLKITGLAILIFYFLPDLSHYLTGEETVLNIYTVTALDLVDNFFLLLPHTMLALTKAG